MAKVFVFFREKSEVVFRTEPFAYLSVFAHMQQLIKVNVTANLFVTSNQLGRNDDCYDKLCHNSCYDKASCNSRNDEAGLNSCYDKAGRNNCYDEAGRIGILLKILPPGNGYAVGNKGVNIYKVAFKYYGETFGGWGVLKLKNNGRKER